MKEVIKLSAPIKAHDEEVTQLELRRPTVVEVRKLKSLPYKIDAEDAVAVDMDVAAKYIALCGHIPSSSVDQLDLADLNNAAWKIVGFFMKPASAPSTS
ncbi:phage tail assembly protein [Pseudomonas kermanshahensis]|uniref:phage tail assembly protein n=1 Tax=Pseudomonas kermanshahensis TaxID=2745482 RepID=UPI0023DA23EF|nr:phage tail assembly protein [Pseudomonas kermanshahensis]WEL56714.1 phage tail assembly protein [Pseudomonas kermanshahensis]